MITYVQGEICCRPVKALKFLGRLASSHASSILGKGADGGGLLHGIGGPLEESALQAGWHGGNIEREGQCTGVGLREGDPELCCGAVFVGLVVEDSCMQWIQVRRITSGMDSHEGDFQMLE